MFAFCSVQQHLIFNCAINTTFTFQLQENFKLVSAINLTRTVRELRLQMLEFHSKPGARKRATEIQASCFLRRQVGNVNCRPRNSPTRVFVFVCVSCVLNIKFM